MLHRYRSLSFLSWSFVNKGILIACWLFLFFFNLPLLHLPLYWDTAWFLLPASQVIHRTGSIFAFVQSAGSDYPHTFLLPLLLSFTLSFPPATTVVLFHIVGLLLSCFFLLSVYLISKRFLVQEFRGPLLILITLNPLFLSQTHLVYFEIIGFALRLLSLKYLLEKKGTAFLVWSLLAVFTRIDNFGFLALLAIWQIFQSKTNYKKNLQWIITYFGPVMLTTAAWLLLNKYLTGWWFYSPARSYDEKHLLTFWQALQYTFLAQGRWFVSGLSILQLIYLIMQKKGKKILSPPQQALYLATFLSLAMPTIFGYLLVRHVFAAIIGLYFVFLQLLELSLQQGKKALLFIGFLCVVFVQWQNWNHCSAYNLEDCLLVTKVLRNKQELVHHLSLDANTTILTQQEEQAELQEPAIGLVDQALSVTVFHDTLPTTLDQQYIYLSNHNNICLTDLAEKHGYVKIFLKQDPFPICLLQQKEARSIDNNL